MHGSLKFKKEVTETQKQNNNLNHSNKKSKKLIKESKLRSTPAAAAADTESITQSTNTLNQTKNYLKLKKIKEKLLLIKKNKSTKKQQQQRDFDLNKSSFNNSINLLNNKNKYFDDLCQKFENILILSKIKIENKNNNNNKNHLSKPSFKMQSPTSFNIIEKKIKDSTQVNVSINYSKNIFLNSNFPTKMFIDHENDDNKKINSNNKSAGFIYCNMCNYLNKKQQFGSKYSLFYNSINNKFCLPTSFNDGLNLLLKRKFIDDDKDDDVVISNFDFKVKRDVKIKNNNGENLVITINNDKIANIDEINKNCKSSKKQKKILCDFKKVSSNVYVGCKPNQINNNEPIICNCTKLDTNDYGCIKNCLNRMTYTECNSDYCKLKDKCFNQNIQKRKWVKSLELFDTIDRGIGVRTLETIPRGQFIIEYVGEVIKEDEFKKRMKNLYKNEKNHYTLSLDSGLVIDSYRIGSVARCINHSCEPNCEVQKWLVNGQYRMCIFAIHDISPGTELTYDYKFHSFNTDNMQVCKCGSSKCRGYVGSKKQTISRKLKNNKEKSDGLKRFNFYYSKKISKIVMNDELTKKEINFIKNHNLFLMRNRSKFIKRFKPKNENVQAAQNDKNTDLIKSYLNSLKSNSSLVSTRRLNQKAFSIAKFSFICLNLYESLLSYIINARSNLLNNNVSAIDYLLFECDNQNLSKIKLNIENGVYEKYRQFENDLFAVIRNALNYLNNDVNNECVQFFNEFKINYYYILSEYLSELNTLENDLNDDKQKLSNESINFTNLNTNTNKFEIEMCLNEIINKICSSTDAETKILSKNSTNKMKSLFVKGKQANNSSNIIIDCICNTYAENCLLIMCSMCEKCQHTQCINIDENDENIEDYRCYKCEPRKFNKEIILKQQPKDALVGLTYFYTLLRDDVQVKVGECFYVMKDRESLITLDGKVRAVPKEILNSLEPNDCDILRVEHLWINENGDKFGSGYYYIRPCDTYHEPNRRFYRNEVVKYPVEDVFPLAAVARQCFVTDGNTYCKGKPKELHCLDDYYVCDFKVDKKARTFQKHKTKYVLNTKEYCFEFYENKLKIKRDYQPHSIELKNSNKKCSKMNSPSSKATKSQKSYNHKSKKLHKKMDFQKKSENLNSIIDYLTEKN